MNSLTRAALIVVSALLINGCASMNKDQCQLANWQALGFQQGNQGKSMARFNTYQQDCAKHQIKADFNAFKTGHEQGLQTYCNFDQGLNTGKQGKDYNAVCPRSQFPTYEEGYRSGVNRFCNYSNGVKTSAQGNATNPNCPASRYPEFHQGFTAGQEQQQLKGHIHSLEDDLDNTQQAMDDASDHISAAEAIIISDTSTSDSRKQALATIKYYKKQYQQLDRDYHEQLDALEHAKQEYETLLKVQQSVAQ